MLDSIHNSGHDTMHQVTKCIRQHPHRQEDGPNGGERLGAPESRHSTQDMGTADPKWSLWNWLEDKKARALARFCGKGNIQGQEGTDSAKEPVALEENRTETARQDGNIEAFDSCAGGACMSAMAEQKHDRMPHPAVWIAERMRLVKDLVGRIRSQYFSGGRFRDRGYQSAEDNFRQTGRQEPEKEIEKESGQGGIADSQEYLLDSYNKNGEYTRLMK